MKKIIFNIFLSVLTLLIFCVPYAQAGKSQEQTSKQYVSKAQKEIRNLLLKQVELSDKRDLTSVKAFYSENYRNSDAFDKNTTFALVRENFEIYPDLKISLKINNIDIKGKCAVADVFEYARKDNLSRDDIDFKGKLRAEARTLYYLENFNGKWLITSEHSIYENNIVTFGETEYLDAEILTPMSVPAGEQYNAEVKINNLPKSALIMGSITKTDAIYPIKENEESIDSYRVFEDTSLERIFTANKDNINEYISAILGITRSKPLPNGDFQLYMSGIAFIMTKVNVIAENTKYTPANDVTVENAEVTPDDILPNDNFVKESEVNI